MKPERAPAFNRIANLAEGMLNTLPHPLLLVDGSDIVIWMNAAAEQFFDRSLKIAEQTELARLVPFGSPIISLLPRVREGRASVTEHGVDLATPRTGENKVVNIHASPSVDLPGGVTLLLQPRGIAERIDSQLISRGSARSVIGLAAMLAHEIKNPLSGIRGAAQLLEQSVGADDRNLTYLIRDETDRIVQLVERMEVFGDERPMGRAEINIHAVLGRVKAIAAAGFASDIDIVEDYDPSLPAVEGNEDRLIQVFLNLLKNAAEAIGRKPNGKIVLQTAFKPGIRIRAPGASGLMHMPLEVRVSDNGPGVPQELRSHLFDAFVTTKESGSGLGLALVAKYVADHGGIVELEGGEGTTVRVLLPWTPQPETGRAVASSGQKNVRGL